MSEEIRQFFCPYCQAWLHEDSTVHRPDHHNDHEKEDARSAHRWRVSRDGGNTWEEE